MIAGSGNSVRAFWYREQAYTRSERGRNFVSGRGDTYEYVPAQAKVLERFETPFVGMGAYYFEATPPISWYSTPVEKPMTFLAVTSSRVPKGAILTKYTAISAPETDVFLVTELHGTPLVLEFLAGIDPCLLDEEFKYIRYSSVRTTLDKQARE